MQEHTHIINEFHWEHCTLEDDIKGVVLYGTDSLGDETSLLFDLVAMKELIGQSQEYLEYLQEEE